VERPEKGTRRAGGSKIISQSRRARALGQKKVMRSNANTWNDERWYITWGGKGVGEIIFSESPRKKKGKIPP